MGGWTRGLLVCVLLIIPLNRSLSDAHTFSDLRSLSLSGLPIARVLLRACVPALMLAYLFTGLSRSYLPTGVPFKFTICTCEQLHTHLLSHLLLLLRTFFLLLPLPLGGTRAHLQTVWLSSGRTHGRWEMGGRGSTQQRTQGSPTATSRNAPAKHFSWKVSLISASWCCAVATVAAASSSCDRVGLCSMYKLQGAADAC